MSARLLIKVVSDIHLEGAKKDFVIKPLTKSEGDITCLILAGDIGYPMAPHYHNFLARVKIDYDYVLVITGNHEYYRQCGKFWTKAEIDEQVANVCKATGCIFLNHDSYDICNVRFLGCTLWSHIPSDCGEACLTDNDFKNIELVKTEHKSDHSSDEDSSPVEEGDKKRRRRRKHVSTNAISVSDYNELHNESVAWLKHQLNQTPRNFKVVVVTHHAPSIKMIKNQYHKDPVSHLYYSNLDLFFRKPVVAWFSGHTHGSMNRLIHGIPSISNCVGYKRERTHYNENMVFEIKLT